MVPIESGWALFAQQGNAGGGGILNGAIQGGIIGALAGLVAWVFLQIYRYLAARPDEPAHDLDEEPRMISR